MIRRLINISALILVLTFSSAAQDGWHEFKSTEGNFALTLPCKPEFFALPITTAGKPGTANNFICVTGEGMVFMGTFADFPAGSDRTAQLRIERDGYVKGFHPGGGTIVSERAIRSGDGLELRSRGKLTNGVETVSVMRFFFVGDRLYGFGIGKMESNNAPMHEAAYFSSFRLLEGRDLTAEK